MAGANQQFPVNPNARLTRGLSSGFQRIAITDRQPHEKDMVRLSFYGTSGSAIYEPIARQSIGNFRCDGLSCCLQFAGISRTGNDPVLVHFSPYQMHAIIMNQLGAGGSFNTDNVIGCVNPNQGVSFEPNPSAAGAQFLMNNLVGQQLGVFLTDLKGNVLTDVSAFFISVLLFERES